MFVDFDRVFHPTKEQMNEDYRLLEEARQKLVDDYMCVMCKNTYAVPWNNHGHEDSVTHCAFTHECVEGCAYGENCTGWDPRDTGC